MSAPKLRALWLAGRQRGWTGAPVETKLPGHSRAGRVWGGLAAAVAGRQLIVPRRPGELSDANAQ